MEQEFDQTILDAAQISAHTETIQINPSIDPSAAKSDHMFSIGTPPIASTTNILTSSTAMNNTTKNIDTHIQNIMEQKTQDMNIAMKTQLTYIKIILTTTS